MTEQISRKQLTLQQCDESPSKYELNEFCLNRTETYRDLNAFITESPRESVLSQAKKADTALEGGKKGRKLEGIPIALKDNFSTEGVKTTAASKILGNYIPNYNATVVNKLKEAGAIFIGKTNMDEFAMGSSNENSAFGAVRNPWNTDCVPGGSSGGSAAAVAAGLAVASFGSDTGGSIRQPCGFCGVVGMKPTYGRVSRFGLLAFASSLDQIGPITNNVRDNATLLEIIAGRDPMDSTSQDVPVPKYEEALENDIAGLKVGVPKEYFSDALNPEIRQGVEKSINLLKGMGVEIVDVSLSLLESAIPCYYVIAPSEASSNLARYDGARYGFRSEEGQGLAEMYQNSRSEGFGKEVQRRIMLGTYALSSGYYDAYYLKALKVRNLITKEFTDTFENIDAIISPVTPTFPFKIGEKTASPWEMYLSDIYTVSANLAGLPGIAMPCSISGEFPVSLQLVGNHFNEAVLYNLAYKLEEALALDIPLIPGK